MAAFSSSSVTALPSTTVGVFSSLEWAKMYPKDQYPSSTWAKTCMFQFLLANGHPDDKVISFMGKFKAKLFTPDAKCFQFTPLIIAVMQGKLSVVKKIIDVAGQESVLIAQLKHSDANGWTAQHHAAIRSNEIYQLLKPLYQNLGVLQTRAAATPLNLRFLSDCEYPSRLQENVYLLEGGKELPILKMSRTELKEKLGLDAYRTVPYYPPESLKPMWMKKGVVVSSSLIFTRVYHELIDSPPKLLVRNSPELKGIVDQGKELIAGQDIPCGKGITTYGGVYSKKMIANSFVEEVTNHSLEWIYRYHSINPVTVGNVSRFTNCGFPNAISCKIKSHGTSFPVFVSLGIKAGEPIIWNYGTTPELHYGKQFLFRRKEMREFFSGGFKVFKDAVEVGQRLMFTSNSGLGTSLIEKNAQSVGYMDRAQFPLYSPAAILDLHFSGIIKAQEWLGELYNMKNNLITLWHQKNGRTKWYFELFLKTIVKLDKAVDRNTAAKHAINRWVLAKIGHLSIMEFAKAFSLITELCNAQKLGTEMDWEAYLSDFDRYFVDYDWSNDPQAPLSLDKKIDLMYRFFIKRNISFKTILSNLETNAKESGKGSEEDEIYQTFNRRLTTLSKALDLLNQQSINSSS